MKMEGLNDINIDLAMCQGQQRTKEQRLMDSKEQRMNMTKDFSLNASQEGGEILRVKGASAEVQKRDINILIGKAGVHSVKTTERQCEQNEDPSTALSLDAEQLEHNYETINKKLLHQVQAADRNYRAHNLDSKVQFQGEETTFIA